ncbi:MAG: tail fiber domain-containing protein, partial [Candidatus Afipia apatlaquensis]|nr:tail fiber domain-containing protein [Candidatus Afipia apatlaquensis]
MPGGSKQTQTSTSQASPYAPAQGSIDSILGLLNKQIPGSELTSTESGALDTLKGNAAAGNQFAPAISSAATGLLNGGGATANDANITANLGDYKGLLEKYANGSQIGNNTALKDQLDTIRRDVSDQVNGQFAAAGRDFSGMNQQTLARGVAQGTAPVIAAQFNADTDRALNAANSIYGAGN